MFQQSTNYQNKNLTGNRQLQKLTTIFNLFYLTGLDQTIECQKAEKVKGFYHSASSWIIQVMAIASVARIISYTLTSNDSLTVQIENSQSTKPHCIQNQCSSLEQESSVILKPAPSKSLCFQKDTSVDLEWAFEGHAGFSCWYLSIHG